MADVKLKNANINGGVAVDLQGVSINWSWNNFVKIPDQPSKFSATAVANVAADFIGWTNPKIVIQGVIDEYDQGTTTLFTLLKSFMIEKAAAIYIEEDSFYPTVDTTLVRPMSLTVRKAADSDTNVSNNPDGNSKGRLDFTLTLVETISS